MEGVQCVIEILGVGQKTFGKCEKLKLIFYNSYNIGVSIFIIYYIVLIYTINISTILLTISTTVFY